MKKAITILFLLILLFCSCTEVVENPGSSSDNVTSSASVSDTSKLISSDVASSSSYTSSNVLMPLDKEFINTTLAPLISNGLKIYDIFNYGRNVTVLEWNVKEIIGYEMGFTKISIDGIQNMGELRHLLSTTFTRRALYQIFSNELPQIIEYKGEFYAGFSGGYGGETLWMPETARLVEEKEDELLIEMDTKCQLADETYRYYNSWRVRLKKDEGMWLIDSPLVDLGIIEGVNQVIKG